MWCVRMNSDVAAETVTRCAMEARELRARERALASIRCERTATSVGADLEQQFVAEFCCNVAQLVLRYSLCCIRMHLCLRYGCRV